MTITSWFQKIRNLGAACLCGAGSGSPVRRSEPGLQSSESWTRTEGGSSFKKRCAQTVKMVLIRGEEASVLYQKYISIRMLHCLHDVRTGFPQKPGDPRQSKAISGNAFHDPSAKGTVEEVRNTLSVVIILMRPHWWGGNGTKTVTVRSSDSLSAILDAGWAVLFPRKQWIFQPHRPARWTLDGKRRVRTKSRAGDWFTVYRKGPQCKFQRLKVYGKFQVPPEIMKMPKIKGDPLLWMAEAARDSPRVKQMAVLSFQRVHSAGGKNPGRSWGKRIQPTPWDGSCCRSG